MLESTLLSVLENRPAHCEVIVVHAHPYQDPYQLNGEVRFIHAPRRSGYVGCANLGLRESTADVVHVLSAGCRVNEGWTSGVLRHFNDPRVAVVAPVMINEREPFRAVAAALSYGVGGVRRSTPRSVDEAQSAGVSPVFAASLAAVFYNRMTLASMGYLSAEVGADLADVDLGLLLQHAGFVSLVEPRSRVLASDQPLEATSAFARSLRAERLFWRNAPLVGWFRALVAHLPVVASALGHQLPGWSVFSALSGHFAGMLPWGSYRRHHQRLDDLKKSAPVADTANDGKRQFRIDRPHDSGTTPVKKSASRAQAA